MYRKNLIIILLALMIFACISMPVSAADTKVDNVNYKSNIYQETEEYVLVDVPQPLDIDTISPDGYLSPSKIANKDNQILPRYVLVVKSGEDVTLIFSIATDGTKFTTDLINPRITLNNIPVTSNTIDGNGDVKIIGTVPWNDPGTAVKLIELENLPADMKNKINRQFVVYTTTNDVMKAKNELYLLNKKYSEDSPQAIKDSLQKAWDSYHDGNYDLAFQAAKGGVDVSTSTEETTIAASWNTIVAIVVCLFIGGLIGVIFDRFWFRKDLTNLERLVLKYYRMRSEKPYAPAPISGECTKALERAFDFNAGRADLLTKLASEKGIHHVNPDSLTATNLKPSLLQALYEKKTYRRSAALDGGMKHLHACLDKKTAGKDTDSSSSPKKSIGNLFGHLRK